MYDQGPGSWEQFVELRHEFRVGATPDVVYAFLLDVHRVVACMPGAELSEMLDPSTFTGKVKVKAGPVTASYDGIARILDRDDVARVAVLAAEGKEVRGGGSAKATATMTVESLEDGSIVKILVDYNVRGRVAQFGRGVMEEVSKMLLDQMALCIESKLAAEDVGQSVPGAGGPLPASTLPTVTTGKSQKANEVNGLKILGLLIRSRIRRLFRRVR